MRLVRRPKERSEIIFTLKGENDEVTTRPAAFRIFTARDVRPRPPPGVMWLVCS